MKTNKKQVGELFKNKREEMTLTLKEVENATSIRIIYLNAIEEGTVDRYLSSVYAHGFIRQYAKFLGLNGDQIIKDNPSAFAPINKKAEFDYGIGTLEMRNVGSSNAKKKQNTIWIIVFLGIAFLAYLLAKALNLF
jgi:cytoskeletal protein RodZ